MSDKSQPAAGPFFALPGHRVLAFQGRDAIAFAQAQFMNDVAALDAGQWQWNGWLTPKGRVIALFALLRRDEETLWLLLPDADPETLAARLRGFLFRSKVTIAVRDDLQISGQFVHPVTAADSAAGNPESNRIMLAADGSVELDMGGENASRQLRISPAMDAAVDQAAAAQWQLADLEHGLPRLDASQVEQWTPQQLSLERLHGFSIKKGCYPGQEIVARTHFLGKAKRGLALLEADALVATGADVIAADATLGRIVASASAGDRHVALAVLPLEHDAAALSVDGQPVREASLKDGLAR
ncbi:MAG TPA: folate-binding protein [Lysobacter sp.]|nr:folate-binding protein [Lysobacter sp.]